MKSEYVLRKLVYLHVFVTTVCLRKVFCFVCNFKITPFVFEVPPSIEHLSESAVLPGPASRPDTSLALLFSPKTKAFVEKVDCNLSVNLHRDCGYRSLQEDVSPTAFGPGPEGSPKPAVAPLVSHGLV